MNEAEVKRIATETFLELTKGNLKYFENTAYKKGQEALTRYFNQEASLKEREAIKEIEKDRYFPIIGFCFDCGWTTEQIAERLSCDTSTISRNKKRLVIAYYNAIAERKDFE